MFSFLTTQKVKAKLACTLLPQQESVYSFSVKCYALLALVLDSDQHIATVHFIIKAITDMQWRDDFC
jgi:hypothetical protein